MFKNIRKTLAYKFGGIFSLSILALAFILFMLLVTIFSKTTLSLLSVGLFINLWYILLPICILSLIVAIITKEKYKNSHCNVFADMGFIFSCIFFVFSSKIVILELFGLVL